MTIKQSGMWCDLCIKPILSGGYWEIGISGKPGHSCDECKEKYEREMITKVRIVDVGSEGT